MEIVYDAVIPISDDLIKVVINNQLGREAYETDSPNSELFQELSKLYGDDIQDLGQALTPSLSKPELNDRAIEIILASGMFKHMEDVKRVSPWLFKDEDFLNHYSNVEDGLHYLYSSMNHYDNTILPSYRELHAQIVVLAHYFPNNSLFLFMRDYIAKMVEEAIMCRNRFTDLFFLLAKERSNETWNFIQDFGLYQDIEYQPRNLDIGFLLKDILKVLG